MSKSHLIALGLVLTIVSLAEAQRQQRGQRGQGQRGSTRQNGQDRIGDSNPLAIGDSGVAWYTTWDTALKEAKRSNRPIFFMSAATTCSGVPGVF